MPRALSSHWLLGIVAGIFLLTILFIFPQGMRAQSTWNPTVLVNTEAFQTIDDSDSSRPVELRFGQGNQEKIQLDQSTKIFTLSRGTKVGGNLTITGTVILNVGNSSATPDTGVALEVPGTISGSRVDSSRYYSNGSTVLYTPSFNTAVGIGTLGILSSGDYNTALGSTAGSSVTTGANNTIVGATAALLLSTGSNNVIMGYVAVPTASRPDRIVVIGATAGAGLNNTSTGIVLLGYGTTASSTFNATAIGYEARVTSSNSLVLGSGANVGIGTTAPRAKLDVVGTISGSSLTISSLNAASCDVKASTAGVLSCGTDATGTGGGNFVTKGGDTMTGALIIQNGNTHSATTTRLLNVRGTMSGKTVWLSSSGSAVAPGLMMTAGGYVGIGTSTPRSKLEVMGSISGRTLAISGNVQIDGTTFYADTALNRVGMGTLSPETTLEVAGTISGSALTLSGLKSCNLDTDANGVITCGTDATGTGGGNFVGKGGDTMTGALIIQNGNTHSATLTRLLNVRGTMSGRNLYVSGSGASTTPLITTRGGWMGFGTDSPIGLFDFRYNSGPVDPFMVFGHLNLNTPLAWAFNNSQGAVSLFVASTADNFVLGTAAGDTGFRIDTSAHKFHIGLSNAIPGLTVVGAGNVGMGTTTPSAKLSVAGTMSGRSLFVAGTGSSPLLRTDVGKGNVGIGVNGNGTAPKAKLAVSGSISGTTLTLSSLRSCNLDTDSNGVITCGTDATGGGGSIVASSADTATTSNTVDSTVTNLTVPVNASTNYLIRCNLITSAAATTTGVQVTVSGPASPTQVTWTRTSCSSTTASVFASINAFGTRDARTASAGATRCNEILNIHLRNGANSGNVTFAVRSEISASNVTVHQGSVCDYSTTF